MIPVEIAVAFSYLVGGWFLFKGSATRQSLREEVKALRQERDDLERRLTEMAENVIRRESDRQYNQRTKPQ